MTSSGARQQALLRPMDPRHLAQENDYFVVEFPPYNSAMVFSIRSVLNKGREYYDYGPLPIATSTAMTSYDGGGGTAPPAAGVMAGREFTTNAFLLKTPTTAPFNLDTGYLDDDTDMFYLEPTKGHGKMMFHTLMKFAPSWLRLEMQVPNNAKPFTFQTNLPGGVDKPLGFMRGYMHAAWIPGLHQSVRVGNDTNHQHYTNLAIRYRQYVVDVVRDPMTIFQILTRTHPMPWLVKWVTMPISLRDNAIPDALAKTYGLPQGSAGFGFYPLHKRDDAIRDYAKQVVFLKEDA